MTDYRQRLCVIDDCGAELWITHTLSRPIFNSDRVEDIANPAEGYTQSWEVGCNEGHVFVLPVDHATDSAVFGECPTCTEDDGTDDPHKDLERVMRHSKVGPTP